MNSKAKKTVELISSLIIIFVLINFLVVIPVFADTTTELVGNVAGGTIKIDNKNIATGVKFVAAVAQVGVIGYFSIRLAVVGIRYFIATTADEKNAKRTAIERTFFWAVIGIGLMYVILYFLGLL